MIFHNVACDLSSASSNIVEKEKGERIESRSKLLVFTDKEAQHSPISSLSAAVPLYSMIPAKNNQRKEEITKLGTNQTKFNLWEDG